MTHDQYVKEFLNQCKRNDPDSYERVCEKYPVISGKRWQTIRQHEISGYGLIGLQPTPRLSQGEADRYDLDQSREED